ncbi:MAG: imidazole glycerol phosphate synthase subunit HisH [Mariprofundaceae bacterium]|nr:imidazole glycerol phosphate synthase subunit HisH [Mariprofundaceae bacterium]
MSKLEVTLIDYGMGNLLSVRRALEHCGARVSVTSDPKEILSTPRLVLPGVGAFPDGMARLRRLGLDAVVREIADSGVPVLGICLGMQMLFDESDEHDGAEGLGLIPGQVLAIPSLTVEGLPQKIPHIGWGSLQTSQSQESWSRGILRDINIGDDTYFVHSFMAVPNNHHHRIADCLYGGHNISAVIGDANGVGCQFHPEKSGEVGLKILRSFISQ